MDGDQFRVAASQLAEYITNYLDNIRERPVLPDVQPFYLQELVPESAPDEPESWDAIFGDIERVILPGMTHWHSPRFNAYFPTANSYPAILADMLSAALGCIGFTWVASPACTELEMRMMDWLGRMLNLPDEFLFSSNGHGGGVIQGTASEATLVTLLAARNKTLSLQDGFSSTGIPSASVDKSGLLEKLVAYCSSQAHSSVERAGLLGAVRFRLLDTDDSLSLRGHTLKDAIERDQAAGLIPFYVVATLGTTNSCAFDNLQELGEICHQKKLWLHVDAAYAGSAFICPEFRHLLNGIELADSFNLNPHKWLMVNFDCSALWLKDRGSLVNSFNVDPVYLKHDKQGQIPDYRHWQIPLGRRFRSLKMWFVMRSYGVKGLQEHIRKQVKLAHEFESLVKTDSRFELKHPVIMGLVTFRLKGSNEMNEQFVKAINQRRNIHITPTKIKGEFIIRFAVCARTTVSSDIEFAWNELRSVANNFAPPVTTSG